MIVLGLDLGTVHPAYALLDLRERKPQVMRSARGDFRKVPSKLRMEQSFQWLADVLQVTTGLECSIVAVEDPTRTLQGVMRDKQTNAHSLQWLMAQFHRITERARCMGFKVVTIEPRTVSARLGLKLTPKAPVAQRRKEKKAQTRKWCHLCVAGATGLSEDECDAVSVAYVGAGLLRVNR